LVFVSSIGQTWGKPLLSANFSRHDFFVFRMAGGIAECGIFRKRRKHGILLVAAGAPGTPFVTGIILQPVAAFAERERSRCAKGKLVGF
jgi:hypothetical protein